MWSADQPYTSFAYIAQMQCAMKSTTMHVPYTHLLAAVATTTLIASAGYQQAQLPSQIETALLDLVNGVNSTQLPDGLTLKATQQQHTPSLFRSSGQLSLGFSTATYNLQYTLQYEVRHGISALFNGAALSAKLINIDSSEPDNSSEERFLVHRQPALFNGTLKPGRVEITGTIPALTGNSPGLLLSSQPAAIAFSASQPGSQQHWSQSHFRLKVPALKLWEDHSRAEGLTLTDLCIEAGQKKAGETLSATMETRLSQLEIKSRTQLLQLSDLQLNNDIQLQDSLSILWSLHFNRFSSRYVQLRNGHIQLALQDIDGDAVRQLINIGQQTSLQNWSAERIRST